MLTISAMMVYGAITVSLHSGWGAFFFFFNSLLTACTWFKALSWFLMQICNPRMCTHKKTLLLSCLIIAPEEHKRQARRNRKYQSTLPSFGFVWVFFFTTLYFSWIFKRLLMQWECSTQCCVLTACHLYLTGLPDGIKTDRFGSLLTWPCFKAASWDDCTVKVWHTSAGWVHCGCMPAVCARERVML